MASVTSNRTVASCIGNGSSNIPLRRSLSRNGWISPTQKTPPSPTEREADRWKFKYEESEFRRKSLLTQNEKNLRSYQELEKQYNNLHSKNEELETELFEKNESLAKLTTVSKSLFQEYDVLKNKYETETGAMHLALNDASNWYRENQVLRRRTLILDHDSVDEGVDDDDSSHDHDLDNLKESVKQLSDEVARLQSELNAAKLLEFETSEQNVNLTQELESEKKRTKDLKERICVLGKENEQLLRVSKMLQKDLEEAKESEQTHKEAALRLRKEADNFRKERNVLAHQSTVLIQGLNSEEGWEHTMLLEVEEVKRTLEEERNRYNLEITALQEKLEEQESNSHMEILEERLKLVEAELEHAKKRADEAEKALIPTPPPPPPAPVIPPPPPPPPSFGAPPTAPLRTKKKSLTPEIEKETHTDSDSSANEDGKKSLTGVNDDIINQIKSGMFTLRKRNKSEVKKERETPKAVNEMLNILGSLRKTAISTRITVSPRFAEVHL